MSSSLVTAGACISEAQYWCALEKSSCPVGSVFVSAGKLETDYKDSPAFQCLQEANSIPMGQCTMSEDNGICTGHKSNCKGCFETTGKCFEPSNGACTLEAKENSDGSLNFAVFGLCIDPQDPLNGHCLWERDECSTSHIWVTPTEWLQTTQNINEYCTCEKVLIGACRYGNEFICAVSEDSCEDGSDYFGSKELFDMEPSIDCRLCDSLELPDNVYSAPPQEILQENITSNYQEPNEMTESQVDTFSTQVSEFLTAAGACVTDEKYWCALERTACPVGSTFVSAKILESDYKNTPAIQCLNQAVNVPLGQCTLPIDEGLCTGDKSNCEGCFETTGKCFEPNNGACTLNPTSNPDGSLNFAVFGLCIDPQDPLEGHCLWDRDECPSTDVWVTPNVWLGNTQSVEDYCTCDKVLVGACRYGDEFRCAVSEDACEDGIEYIGAKELVNMEIDCRLCDDLNLPENAKPTPQQLPSQLSRDQKTAAAGACVNDKQYWCVLEKTQCPQGSDFVSARILLAEYKNTPAIKCLDETVTVPMGQCTLPSDNGLCTGHKSNCQGCFETAGECFEPESETCTLETAENKDGSLNVAEFGLCVNPQDPTGGHCLWSREECPQMNVWITPTRRLEFERSSSATEDFCTCDKVLVGACRFGNNFVCAVSEEACDGDSEYIGASQLKEIAPSIDCRLCASVDAPEKISFDSPYDEQNDVSNSLVSPTPTYVLVLPPPKEPSLEISSSKASEDDESKHHKRKSKFAMTIIVSCLVSISAIMFAAWKVGDLRALSCGAEASFEDDNIMEQNTM